MTLTRTRRSDFIAHRSILFARRAERQEEVKARKESYEEVSEWATVRLGLCASMPFARLSRGVSAIRPAARAAVPPQYKKARWQEEQASNSQRGSQSLLIRKGTDEAEEVMR